MSLSSGMSLNAQYPLTSFPITRHPYMWTVSEVRAWLLWCQREYGLSQMDISNFDMNGKGLCLLNEDDFRRRVPKAGDLLYRILQQLIRASSKFSQMMMPPPFCFPTAGIQQFLPSAFARPPQSTNGLSFANSPLPGCPVLAQRLQAPPLFLRPLPSEMLRPVLSHPDEAHIASSPDEAKLDIGHAEVKQEPRCDCPTDEETASRQAKGVASPEPESLGVGLASEKGDAHFFADRVIFKGEVLRRPANAKNCRILWEYLFLLLDDAGYTEIIRWEDRDRLVFRICQAEKLAKLWGLQKNRRNMTYEKLSRGMRYYYNNNIIAREPGRRLLYRFLQHPDEIRRLLRRQGGTYMSRRPKASPEVPSHENSDTDSESIQPIQPIQPSVPGVEEQQSASPSPDSVWVRPPLSPSVQRAAILLMDMRGSPTNDQHEPLDLSFKKGSP